MGEIKSREGSYLRGQMTSTSFHLAVIVAVGGTMEPQLQSWNVQKLWGGSSNDREGIETRAVIGCLGSSLFP